MDVINHLCYDQSKSSFTTCFWLFKIYVITLCFSLNRQQILLSSPFLNCVTISWYDFLEVSYGLHILRALHHFSSIVLGQRLTIPTTVGLISENVMFASKKHRYFSVVNDKSFDLIMCDGHWLGYRLYLYVAAPVRCGCGLSSFLATW